MNNKKKKFIKTPYYPGGTKAMAKFIDQNLNYPTEAKENYIEGIVQMKIQINENGNVEDAKILKGIGYGCDEEALRIAKLLKYSSARQKGVHVKITTKLSIKFTIVSNNSVNITYNYKPFEQQGETKAFNYILKTKKQI